MDETQILKRVRKAFGTVISAEAVEQIVPGAVMEDVDGWDSMNFINLVMAIEDEFNIQMNTVEAASLSSVNAVVSFVLTKV